MASSSIKGVKVYRSRGKVYHYHRATKTRLRAEPGTAGFFLEIATLDKREALKAEAGSLRKLVQAFQGSEAWRSLAPATRLSYDRAIAAMKPIELRALKEFTPPFVAAYRDIVLKTRKRWMANYVLTVMVILFDFARERGWMPDNPAKGIRRVRRPKSLQEANRPWTPAECRAVLDAAPPYLAVPIALGMFAGFRKRDVIRIEKTAIQGPKLVWRTSKTAAPVRPHIHPDLANVLALAPNHKASTIAANSRGQPWTESGFNSTFCKLIGQLEEAGKVDLGLTFHGLRHTVGTRLAEAGVSEDMIRRILGHQTSAMAKHYTKTADVTAATASAMGKMRVVG